MIQQSPLYHTYFLTFRCRNLESIHIHTLTVEEKVPVSIKNILHGHSSETYSKLIFRAATTLLFIQKSIIKTYDSIFADEIRRQMEEVLF